MTEKNEKKPESEEVETERVEEGPGTYYAPVVDIYDTDDAIVVEADMPGVERDGVEVKIDNGVLSILGRARETSAPGVTRLYEELTHGDYYRAFALGEEVDEGGIAATVSNGVLTVSLPRARDTRVRKIEVK
ncbi:MAG TPA: Hsp20/alpha crystallin family protein [Planctomycetota bacterium]|nr:Hsp20/alpha crystallin family protein [Planctomycetota bacterium]